MKDFKIINAFLSLSIIFGIYCDTDASSEKELYEKAVKNCVDSTSDVNKCISKSSAFNFNTKEYQAECCLMKYKTDNYATYKNTYGENWEEEYGFIKEYIQRYSSISVCSPINKDQELKDTLLYGMTVQEMVLNFTYDCGEGEKTFDPVSYNPTSQTAIGYKEAIDCGLISTKDNCLSAPNNFKSEAKCCWITQKSDEIEYDINCKGYSSETTRTSIQEEYKYYNMYNYTYKFECNDKSGTKNVFEFNTNTSLFQGDVPFKEDAKVSSSEVNKLTQNNTNTTQESASNFVNNKKLICFLGILYFISYF